MPDEDTELFFDQLDDEVLMIDKTFRGVLKLVAMIPLDFLFIVETFLAMPELIRAFSFKGDFTAAPVW